MGLKHHLEDEVWRRLQAMSTTSRPAREKASTANPQASTAEPLTKPRKGRTRAGSAPRDGSAQKSRSRASHGRVKRPRAGERRWSGPLAETTFERRLRELRGILVVMRVSEAGRGPSVQQLDRAGMLARWLHDNRAMASPEERVELRDLLLTVNDHQERRRARAVRPRQVAERQPPREVRPLDVSSIPLGPESGWYFTDPVDSK